MNNQDGTKRHVIWHIKSARQWLERAERAFDEESPARGELDLILARAEVQHAQEKRTFAFPVKLMMYAFRNKKTWGIALGGGVLSVLLLTYAGTYASRHMDMVTLHSVKPKTQLEIPATVILRPTSPLATSSETSKAYPEVVHEEQAKVSGNAAHSLPSVQNTVSYAEARTPVSEAEMRMLTRTAERVLKSTQ